MAVHTFELSHGGGTLRADADESLALSAMELLAAFAVVDPRDLAGPYDLQVGGIRYQSRPDGDGWRVWCGDMRQDLIDRLSGDLTLPLFFNLSQERTSALLQVEYAPVLFTDHVLVENGAFDADRVYLQRTGPEIWDGWYLGNATAQAKVTHERHPLYRVTRQYPVLTPYCALPLGYRVFVSSGEIEAVLDPAGQRVMGAGGTLLIAALPSVLRHACEELGLPPETVIGQSRYFPAQDAFLTWRLGEHGAMLMIDSAGEQLKTGLVGNPGEILQRWDAGERTHR